MKKYMTLIILAVAAGAYFGGRYLYFKPKYGPGEMAEDFGATLIDNSPFRLADLRGDYVLLSFWASWCGPCRKENPALVDLYKAFGRTGDPEKPGFEIVSVGLETDERAWIAAIERDGLVWPYHIGQFERFDSGIAALYRVREVPTKFLIDPEGVILFVNPSVQQVAAYLSDHLVAEVQ